MALTTNQFKTQLWQETDKTFRDFLSSVKPVSPFHALRLMVGRLAYKLLGHQYLYIWARKNAVLRAGMQRLDTADLNELGSWLGDDYSKQMLIKLMLWKAFQGLVPPKPLRDRAQEKAILERTNDFIQKAKTYTGGSGNNTYDMNLYDLSDLGYPMTLHLRSSAVKDVFVNEQYHYKQNKVDVSVQEGDIVLDGGGWVGDTALYFVLKGAKQVYSFEFLPENLEIYNQNLAANPKLVVPITIVRKALWNKDGVQLSFEARGSGTSVTKSSEGTLSVEAITIDTLVEQMKIERVDFIKMDIEGSELNALEGAANTIKRFEPKLAICVYHKPEDIFVIPQLIKRLNPDYTLYLDNFTAGPYETVLFALPKKH